MRIQTTIPQIPSTNLIVDDDEFILEKNEGTRRATASTLKNYIGSPQTPIILEEYTNEDISGGIIPFKKNGIPATVNIGHYFNNYGDSLNIDFWVERNLTSNPPNNRIIPSLRFFDSQLNQIEIYSCQNDYVDYPQIPFNYIRGIIILTKKNQGNLTSNFIINSQFLFYEEDFNTGFISINNLRKSDYYSETSQFENESLQLSFNYLINDVLQITNKTNLKYAIIKK